MKSSRKGCRAHKSICRLFDFFNENQTDCLITLAHFARFFVQTYWGDNSESPSRPQRMTSREILALWEKVFASISEEIWIVNFVVPTSFPDNWRVDCHELCKVRSYAHTNNIADRKKFNCLRMLLSLSISKIRIRLCLHNLFTGKNPRSNTIPVVRNELLIQTCRSIFPFFCSDCLLFGPITIRRANRSIPSVWWWLPCLP